MSFGEIFAFMFTAIVSKGVMSSLTSKLAATETGVLSLGIVQMLGLAVLAAYKRRHIRILIIQIAPLWYGRHRCAGGLLCGTHGGAPPPHAAARHSLVPR